METSSELLGASGNTLWWCTIDFGGAEFMNTIARHVCNSIDFLKNLLECTELCRESL